MRERAIFVQAAVMLTTAGCANHAAIAKLSDSMVATSASWNDVAIASRTGCRRSLEFSDQPGDCNTADQAAAAVIQINNVLAAYFAALGSVAADKNYTVREDVGGLASSVGRIPGVSKDDAEAVGGLSGVLIDLVVGARRERTTRRLIDEGAPPARDIVAFLSEVVRPTFDRKLSTERMRIRLALRSGVSNANRRLGADSSRWCDTMPVWRDFSGDGHAFLMATELCRRDAEVRRYQATIAAYEDSLAAADAALVDLQSAKTRLSAAETAQLFYERAADLRDRIDAIRKPVAEETEI